ncbi:MAG: hypothetical protein WC254_05825, partial [Candidatus Woesearchaeota archaeon]
VLTSAVVVENNKSNIITGDVIGITGASTANEIPVIDKDKQIGVYTLLPSFSFPQPYPVTEEYSILQEQIRLFYQNTQECRQTNILDECITSELNTEEYSSWLNDCETNDEKLFYDFTEIFSQCLASEDSNCACIGKLNGDYDAGEYTIKLIQDQKNIVFSLEDLMLSMPFTFTIEETPMKSDDYIVHVDNTGVIGSFSSLEPSSELYVYKSDTTTLSVEDQTTFTTYEMTRDSCTLPSQEIYKFCMQSDTVIGDKPLVYIFAIDFSE